ncbi:hypothetical protein UK23_09710 [Lentzea aerocolonigenes]|uniref:Uncharacterized protein n=1 Tax=Lentzea aerocolonigenes TaxID=68170 RepID=A0A0F0HAN5_LENAE|nr:hypothetical protein UK23_09710 [Lentzea aerocolonigenes]
MAAEDFANEERIKPAAFAVPGNIRTYVLRRDDGSEVVVSIAETEQALIDTQKAILSTTLLPGEDPALLPGADRVEIYPVHQVFEHGEALS